MAEIRDGRLVPGTLTADDLEMELDACSSFGGGMIGLMQHLQQVCCDKAEHVQTNWQDKALAREWEKARKVFKGAEWSLRKINL